MTAPNPYAARCIGILLGTAVGDILGLPVQGASRADIAARYGTLRDFQESASGKGAYSGDTQLTLALADSIASEGALKADACARSYARHFQTQRQYSKGLKRALQALQEGRDYRETGTLIYRDGSMASGGAMRIAPVGIVYRDTDEEKFKRLVYRAIMSTHAHPEGVDGAFIQARAVGTLSGYSSAEEFDPASFLAALRAFATTNMMKQQLRRLEHFHAVGAEDEMVVHEIGCDDYAVEAVPCALWAAVKYYREPEEAVIRAVGFGGDADTIGAMCGALMGALHGHEWIPDRWLKEMENGERGRDWMIDLGRRLAAVTV